MDLIRIIYEKFNFYPGIIVLYNHNDKLVIFTTAMAASRKVMNTKPVTLLAKT